VDITESNTLQMFGHIHYVPDIQLTRTVLCHTAKMKE